MILGIDVGGTTIKFGVVNDRGAILETERHDTLEYSKTQESFIGLLELVVKKYIQKYPSIVGVGIGIPGQLSLDRLTLVQANNLGSLNGTPVVSLLKKSFPNLVIKMENDANCTALGELYFGGHDKDSFIMIALGTGVGGGVIVHRKLFIGAKGNAGEVGFLVVGPKRQVLEKYLGQRQIVAYVKEQLTKSENKNSSLNTIADLTVEQVFLAAKNGDQFAIDTWNYFGTLIGETIVGLAHAYDINKFIIGGGVGKAFEMFKDAAITTANSYFSPYYSESFELLPAGCEADTGLVGAAALVLNELETC